MVLSCLENRYGNTYLGVIISLLTWPHFRGPFLDHLSYKTSNLHGIPILAGQIAFFCLHVDVGVKPCEIHFDFGGKI